MSRTELTRLPFLAGLSAASRGELLAQSAIEQHSRGHVFFSSGDAPDDLHIIIDGKVKLTRRARRQPPPLPPITGKVTVKELRRRAQAQPVRESLLWLMGPGEMFGELSLFDVGNRSTSATASTDGATLRITGSAMRTLIATHHDICQAMLRQMASRLRRSDDQTAGLLVSDLPGRLAHLLLSLAERFGERTGEGIQVRHDLTQSEMAQIVGSSRESVNKALSDFEQRGIVEVGVGSLLIRDADKLTARVG
ncbi:Crp/Fnr family transcriptional regulator [Aestuariimicrobium ganziense]|uniref:Crp/Fnr family transcriptional regulator n=1 Tax=Aestuariimicrobium ganziense TaxID=2773677 RepID=UPI001943247B|nr:Crp/Fnr family transcriptional regulator [Aestuariimicrobium ganziense]